MWKIRTGQCLRKYERAHTQGVTAVSFSKDGTHVLSSSYDGLVRVHGIKSGKMLKELRGHTSYVNDAIYSPDGSQVRHVHIHTVALLPPVGDSSGRHGLLVQWCVKRHVACTYLRWAFVVYAALLQELLLLDVWFVLLLAAAIGVVAAVCMSPCVNGLANLLQIVSASSDASVRVWDSKSCDCLTSFRLPQTSTSGEASVNSVHFYPQNPDQIIVCNRSSTIFIMTLHGHVVKSFQSGKREGGDFLACWVSPKGEWIYCLGEDSILYSFSTATGKLENLMQVADKGPIGLCQHPHRNLVATYADEGSLKLWKA